MKIQNILTALIFTVLISSCDNSVEPDEINYHNKILFTSSKSGKPQLYMMNPDGTDIKQITSGNYSHSNGRWSPDASKIVCNTDENWSTAGMQMVVMYSDGTNRTLLGIGSQMIWFPITPKIFYTYCPSCELGIFNAGLYCFDLESSNISLVTNSFAGDIDFSPDGKTIIYGYADHTDSIPNPVLMLIDYPELNNSRKIGPNGITYPKWSPNGSEIVFSSNNNSATVNGTQVFNIFIMNADGTNVKKLTDHTTMEHFLYPRWSPDGSKIIFISYSIDGTQQTYLYMVNKDGTDLHKMLDDSSVSSADWSK